MQVISKFVLEFPPWFEDHDWEVVAKGWFAGVVAVIEGRRYTLTVYDPVRLAQDVEEELKLGRVFLEPNLVVVASVTRENIAAAVQEIVDGGRVGDLRVDPG
jgi:hypothetical protein